MIPLSLRDALDALGSSLRSIDLRAAIAKTAERQEEVLLLAIRVSARPVDEVRKRHDWLRANYGPTHTPSLRVLFDVRPFLEVGEVMEDIMADRILLNDVRLPLRPQLGTALMKVKAWVDHWHRNLRVWGEYALPQLYFAADAPGGRSPLFSDEGLTREVGTELGFESVDQLIDAFFDLNQWSSQRSAQVVVGINVPAKIMNVSLIDRKASIEVIAEKNLVNDLRLVVLNRGGSNVEIHWKTPVPLTGEAKEEGFCRLRGEVVLPLPLSDDHRLRCALSTSRLPELDELSGPAHDWRPREERNPLVASLREFWNLEERLFSVLEKPYEDLGDRRASGRAKERGERQVQERYQEAAARLLSLLGFQAVDLERYDNKWAPGTNVLLATVDVLAYHAVKRLLAVVQCTMNVPKGEDFDKLLSAGTYLRQRVFNAESAVRIVPLLFCWQEDMPLDGREAEKRGIVVINVPRLHKLKELIEHGEGHRFAEHLTSPAFSGEHLW